jgi:hypothetical protein
MFPLLNLELNEYERRIKKLVFEDDYITVFALVECFKSCRGFEDIENHTSFCLNLFTSDFLKKEY